MQRFREKSIVLADRAEFVRLYLYLRLYRCTKWFANRVRMLISLFPPNPGPTHTAAAAQEQTISNQS